jgi:hypothetical protein
MEEKARIMASSSSSERRSLRLRVRSRSEKENTSPLMDQAQGEAANKKCKSKHAEEVVNRLETAKKIQEAEEVTQCQKAETAKADEIIVGGWTGPGVGQTGPLLVEPVTVLCYQLRYYVTNKKK